MITAENMIIPGDLSDGEIYLQLNTFMPYRANDVWTPNVLFHIRRCADDVRVGRCDLRFCDNDLIYYAGHIGYMVFEEYRGHAYAQKACRQLRKVALANGFYHVVITCDSDNIASRRTCENLGCTLLGIEKVPRESELYWQSSGYKCRYWFPILQEDIQTKLEMM